MSYQKELIAHLVAYKTRHFDALPAGTFRHRGADLTYDHVLPARGDPRNFLDHHREAIVSFASKRRIKLHKFFHHLNSSQALALNLFAPFFEGGEDASRALLLALDQDAELVDWEPEAIPDPIEGSNLDAVWTTSDGVKTVCEVKLSERDFGKARADDRHFCKLSSIYMPRLAPYLTGELRTPAGFFGAYQILRNVWHMVGDPDVAAIGRLIFLIPRANAPLWPMLDRVISGLSPLIADRIQCVALEELLVSIAGDASCPLPFREYAERLRDKYVPAFSCAAHDQKSKASPRG